jgi:hypothetical protein
MVIIIPHVSAKLQCSVCPNNSPCLTGNRVNIFNISEDGMIWASNSFTLTNGREVWCNDTGLMLGGNTPIIRISDLTDAHAQVVNYPPPNYQYTINLTYSVPGIIQCYYNAANCDNFDTCVVSMEDVTNSHVGNCSSTLYASRLCCNTTLTDTTGPVCDNIWISPSSRVPWTNQNFDVLWSCTDPSGILRYNLEYNVTRTDGSPDTPWALLYSGLLASYPFTPAANNHTYFFRVNATDTLGNTGSYSAAAASTTFDNEMPVIVPSLNDDGAGNVSLSSVAWDNVSGILYHNISCTVTNPSATLFVQCESAAPFGGISDNLAGGVGSCQTPNVSYNTNTQMDCDITAQDRAGNVNVVHVTFVANPDHPLAEFTEGNIIITIGETYHSRVRVKNFNESQDKINVSLSGIYPKGLVRFLNSSPITWISPDGRNITVLLNPFEQRFVYLEIVSTDEGTYPGGVEIHATSTLNADLTDYDRMNIIIGYPAAFPGLELLSITMLVALSVIAYRKTSGKGKG